ncbi:HAD hydrolase-like protein [Candidatus Shapirobacteria bacterium]|nr:HAD hydrolase-like protein [Candidatus Shapirobacteria bacterium]
MENEIGNNLKKYRTKRGLTQKDLAKLLGCTDIMVSRYELGISQVSITQLEKISKILGVQVSSFFGNSTSSTSNSSNFKSVFVFDLDDTLVDGRQFCGETIARVITNVSPSTNFDLVVQLHESVRGMTIEDLYLYILKELNLKLDVKELLIHDKKIQESNIDKMHIFDGVVDILEFLKTNNKELYICTNRSKDLMEKVLMSNQILPYFDKVISCVDAGYKKPNPYCLLNLIDGSGKKPEEFIYFGDSEVDSQFAANANIDHMIFDQYLNNKNIFKKLVNMFLEKQINGN